jgi:poly(ADP-ribose) polymerase-like protein
MPNVFEPASSGRAKCRGCSRAIAKGEIRFGERLPNPFADGEMTIWFHPLCAAYKRPEPLLETLAETQQDLPDRAALELAARKQMQHRRLPRISGAERAPSGQAKCRSCREPIERASWRIRLVFYEEGQFSPGGFVHLACRTAYFETEDVLDPLLHFSPDLSSDERSELLSFLECGTGA